MSPEVPTSRLIYSTAPLADTVGFELLGADLSKDVEYALETTLAGGAVFPNGTESGLCSSA